MLHNSNPPLNKIILGKKSGGVSIPIVFFLEPYGWDGGEGGGRGGGEEGEEGEGEGGQQNWSCGKKFPLLPCLVQVCYCYSGACKGGQYPLWTCFLAFFSNGFIRKLLFGNWIRFLESKLLLIKSEGCFGKDLLYLTLLAILKVNGANWLLVLEKNWSCEKMFLLLTRYHYWLDNISGCWRSGDIHSFGNGCGNCGQYRILVNRGQLAMNRFKFSIHAFRDVVKYSIRGLNHQLIISVLFYLSSMWGW